MAEDNTPEHIAFMLMKEIARVEKKILSVLGPMNTGENPDRKWILETYAQCLAVVRDPNARINIS